MEEESPKDEMTSIYDPFKTKARRIRRKSDSHHSSEFIFSFEVIKLNDHHSSILPYREWFPSNLCMNSLSVMEECV